MIHGRDRGSVSEQISALRHTADVQEFPYRVLFSRRRFKQRGARYDAPAIDTKACANG
jgi:hypothetical protein